MTPDTHDLRGDSDYLTLGAQRRFTNAAKMRMQIFASFPAGLLLGGGCGLIISGCGLAIARTTFGYASLENPLPAILIGFALAVPGFYFLPDFSGNTRIAKWFASRPKGTWMVQLTLTPRRYTGMEGLAEGADDVGVLSIEPGRLVYSGDAIDFSISRDKIQAMATRNLGWRGLWSLGNAIDLTLAQPIAGISGLALAPRQDATLPNQWRSARKLEASLSRWLNGKITLRREPRPVSPLAYWRWCRALWRKREPQT